MGIGRVYLPRLKACEILWTQHKGLAPRCQEKVDPRAGEVELRASLGLR